jgi:hypothetical protein
MRPELSQEVVQRLHTNPRILRLSRLRFAARCRTKARSSHLTAQFVVREPPYACQCDNEVARDFYKFCDHDAQSLSCCPRISNPSSDLPAGSVMGAWSIDTDTIITFGATRPTSQQNGSRPSHPSSSSKPTELKLMLDRYTSVL